MAEQTSNADVTAELSDESVDKFFETGGDAEEAEITEEKSENDVSDENDSQEDDSQDSQPKQDKKVPYGALHEERERRKELQRQVQEIQRKNQRMEETFQQMMQRLQYGQQQPQYQQPTYEEDPLGTLKAKTENLERFLAQQQQAVQYQAQMEQQQSQFINRYQRSAEAFIQDKPDFKEAYQHLVSTKLQEYQEAGYTGEQAKHLLHEDEAAIVAKAYQDGVNPAERIYKIAKMRGFGGGTRSNEQRLNQLEKGVQASKSLSSTPGKSGKAAMRLEEIAELPDEEFKKVDWDKLMRLG
jgi:hypothetical protein